MKFVQFIKDNTPAQEIVDYIMPRIPLKPGDVVEVTIEGIGTLKNKLI